LNGQCDVVEFHSNHDVLPVEYKRGQPKAHAADEVQLCAQVLCLEEMLGLQIERGKLYYGKRRRRTDIVFHSELRGLTHDTARRLHELIDSRETPLAQREKKCESCSLLEICMPDAMRFRRTVASWFAAQLADDEP
jgi:CRISPR-associated exonuclease Cas4